MSNFQPTTTDEWIRNQTKQTNLLQRRGRGRDLGNSGAIRMALLDPAYRGEGAARVTFEGYPALSTDYYAWQTDYVPWASRSVVMMRVGGTWEIAGQSGATGYGGKYRVPLVNTATSGKWNHYSLRQQDPSWGDWTVTRYASGIVVHTGLIFPVDAASAVSGTVIAVLPPPFRPDGTVVFPINNGDLARAIEIRANGEVVVRPNWATNYASLSGFVAYPAAGVATWTNIQPQGTPGSDHAFLNGFVPFDATPTNQPAYWMDPYGLVWLRGLIKTASVPGTDNTGMFSLPVSHRAYAEMHLQAARNDDLGLVGASPSSAGVNFKTNIGYLANQWISLAGVTITTAQSRANDPWYDVPYFVNGWGNLAGSFTKASMLRRGDGLGILNGLMVAPASLGTWPFVYQRELVSEKQQLIPVVSSLQRGRVDTYGYGRDQTNRPIGSFSVVQGVAGGWVSIDGMKLVAG